MKSSSLILVFLIYTFFSSAQNISTSAFSVFGLGDKEDVKHPVFQATGKVAGIHVDSTILNFHNPASYSSLSPGKILFSTSLTGRFSFVNDQESNVYQPSSSLHHFALALSFKKHFGLCFGLRPYFSKGYSFSNEQYTGLDSLIHTYEGRGNSQLLFLGLSTNLIKWKGTHLSIGGNVAYLFGSLQNTRTSAIVSSSSNAGGIELSSEAFSSLYYNFGLYFNQKLSENHALKLAFCLEPSQKLRSTYSKSLFYSENIYDPSIFDTLSNSVCSIGNCDTQIPLEMDFSFAYAIKFNGRVVNNKKRLSELKLIAGYRQSDWSSYVPNDDSYNNIQFSKSRSLGFGLQFIPEMKYLEKALITSWYERIYYRTGYFQNTLPYKIDGNEITDFGMTFGIGLPIVIQQSLSSVNFGVVLGNRGSGITNEVDEKYIGINFGLILSPSNFGRWFRKRKLD
tara:strand:+ start:97 stop:1452 length:1356 start_codon:yes stop_codon:yes gene_type:complete